MNKITSNTNPEVEKEILRSIQTYFRGCRQAYKSNDRTILEFIPLSDFDQQLNIDSLQAVWKDEKQPDSNRFKAIDEIVWDGYIHTQLDSAFFSLAKSREEYGMVESSAVCAELYNKNQLLI